MTGDEQLCFNSCPGFISHRNIQVYLKNQNDLNIHGCMFLTQLKNKKNFEKMFFSHLLFFSFLNYMTQEEKPLAWFPF
jgi:hypothetical protein